MNFEPQLMEIGIEEIIPNRFQPRLTFDEQAMEELAASIKEHGIIQPLVLRRVGNKYEIIAGERRYKAAIMAGLQKVPAIITSLDDNSSAEVALVENVQRKSLTPIEEAKSYKILLDRGYVTQEELAKRIGVSQPTIANRLRLLNLDEEVQKALLEEQISERHARSMLKVQDFAKQKELLRKVIEGRWTVRQLDDEIKSLISDDQKMDNTPLVEITPSVDQIKNSALDLSPKKETLGIEQMLRTEGQMPNNPIIPEQPIVKEEPLIPDVSEAVVEEPNLNAIPDIPSAPASGMPNPSTPPTPNKFFNFLEDEEANMNILDKPIAGPSSIPVVEPKEEKEVEILDLPSVPLSMDNVIDPVSKIETLDPSYIPPKPQEEKMEEFSLKSAINMLRDTVKIIEEKGLLVDTEEIDLENLYQIIIKIDKKTE